MQETLRTLTFRTTLLKSRVQLSLFRRRLLQLRDRCFVNRRLWLRSRRLLAAMLPRRRLRLMMPMLTLKKTHKIHKILTGTAFGFRAVPVFLIAIAKKTKRPPIG